MSKPEKSIIILEVFEIDFPCPGEVTHPNKKIYEKAISQWHKEHRCTHASRLMNAYAIMESVKYMNHQI